MWGGANIEKNMVIKVEPTSDVKVNGVRVRASEVPVLGHFRPFDVQ